jgi:hypothetical protein
MFVPYKSPSESALKWEFSRHFKGLAVQGGRIRPLPCVRAGPALGCAPNPRCEDQPENGFKVGESWRFDRQEISNWIRRQIAAAARGDDALDN